MRRRARPRATRSVRSLDLDTFAGLRPLSARAVAYGAVMAERVSLEGLVYVKRSPTGAYLLTVVTLLVYFFVWYYKINDETRRYLRDDSIRPWHSVLAIFPGVLLIVPYFVSLYQTAERIRLVEERSGSPKRVRPVLGTVCGFEPSRVSRGPFWLFPLFDQSGG